MDSAIAFWTEALGARVVTTPVLRSGGYFDQMFVPGVKVMVAHLALDRGALELFEFVEPRRPVPPSDQTGDGAMHFGVQVDDAEETLRRVIAAGGRALLPLHRMQNRPENPGFVYCATPDGHVFELLEVDHPTVARLIIEAIPEACPTSERRSDGG
jgi:catechol 2,3-dioxygenase-like lactoylglutathione lyase family enzyme